MKIKGLFLVLPLLVIIAWELWKIKNTMLGISMDNEDFDRWIHDDLEAIHEHLDEPTESGWKPDFNDSVA